MLFTFWCLDFSLNTKYSTFTILLKAHFLEVEIYDLKIDHHINNLGARDAHDPITVFAVLTVYWSEVNRALLKLSYKQS